MQLLGVYLYEMSADVRKVLTNGWYPFGRYEKPAHGKPVKIIKSNSYTTSIRTIYNRSNLPEITVNCIVGMNGAGKSTLLDILYRIINNFAIRLLGEHRKNNHGRELHFAYGVNADLFVLVENIQYKIQCRNNTVRFYESKDDGVSFQTLKIRDGQDPKPILRKLFYTISTNYSLYAFNPTEYTSDLMNDNFTEINGKWLSGVFHKNDGYFTPIVITPYRENGNIDIENENKLANQRVMAMALLSYAQNASFLPNHEPNSIKFHIDLSYKERIEYNYQKSISTQYEGFDIRHVIRFFEQAWNKYFEEEYGDIEGYDERVKTSQYNLALFYMAYKTLKICMTYDDFWKAMGVSTLLKHCSKLEDFLSYTNKNLPVKTKVVINKILHEIKNESGEYSHITLKLTVCMKYIEMLCRDNDPSWPDNGSYSIKSLVMNKSIRTYNDAVSVLPPAFFDTSMTFVPNGNHNKNSSWTALSKDGFTLGKMSSGERQILYSLSYVLYHIKNLQSVQEDENRVAYHNICLIFDEAELYYHPDYQRRFLNMLLESLSWCNIDTKKIKSIQILIVTHSPFVLSDMLTENTLYLEEGKILNVTQQTFGANYYDMLSSSFFFRKSAIGDVASSKIRNWVEKAQKGIQPSNDELSLIGDEMILNYIKSRKENRNV